jgi:cytochrome c-type biogenesis protein CcmH
LSDVGSDRVNTLVSKRFLQGSVLALLLLLPLTFGLYRQWGEPDAMDPEVMALSQADNLPPAALERALVKRLNSRPGDAEAWIVLARVQRAQSEFALAAQSFEHAYRLTQDPVLNLERLEALAMQQGGRLEGDPDSVVRAALAANPNNSRVLLLAGQVAFARADYDQALAHWHRLWSQLPPASEGAQALEQAMAAARRQGGHLPSADAAAAPAAKTAQAFLQGRLILSSSLLAQVKPQDTLFITAVAVGGPPMPLAVLKRPASALLQAPNHVLEFRLDDRLAMSPQASLSSLARSSAAAQVLVRARISKSGNPIPQPQDWLVQSSPVALGSRGIVLTLSETVH